MATPLAHVVEGTGVRKYWMRPSFAPPLKKELKKWGKAKIEEKNPKWREKKKQENANQILKANKTETPGTPTSPQPTQLASPHEPPHLYRACCRAETTLFRRGGGALGFMKSPVWDRRGSPPSASSAAPACGATSVAELAGHPELRDALGAPVGWWVGRWTVSQPVGQETSRSVAQSINSGWSVGRSAGRSAFVTLSLGGDE